MIILRTKQIFSTRKPLACAQNGFSAQENPSPTCKTDFQSKKAPRLRVKQIFSPNEPLACTQN